MVDLRNAPSYYNRQEHQVQSLDGPTIPETPAQRSQHGASDKWHSELIDDYWRKPNSPSGSGTAGTDSELDDVMRRFGSDNGRRLRQLSDLVQDDGGTPGEVTREDLDAAIAAPQTVGDRKALKYMRENLGEISHENDMFGGTWGDALNYVGSQLELWGYDDSIGLKDLQDYAQSRSSLANEFFGPPGQTPQQADGDKIRVGNRSYTLDTDGTLNYTIQKGDSIYRIAGDLLEHTLNRPATEMEKRDFAKLIVKANPYIKNADRIYPNDTLRLPPPYAPQAE